MEYSNGKRFYSLNQFFREKFGDKAYKIALDGGFSCPNRDGKISTMGCIYCSEKGSGDFAGNRSLSIHQQFSQVKSIMSNKWKSNKYIAYFQAFTNTYAPVSRLREKYYEAISEEGVVGLSVATRPDSISEGALDLLEEINSKFYTFVELGLQTSDEETAKLINRGYALPVFEDAVNRIRKRNIDVVVHIIFGLPGENKEKMINTVKYISSLDIQGVKFHLLYLLKNTPLIDIYENGGLKFLSGEEYIDIITEAIGCLPPGMVIHRLTGDAPRDLLIGPNWSIKKWEILNQIDTSLKDKNIYQGLYFHTN